MDEIMFHDSFKNGHFVQVPELVIKWPALTMQARLLYTVLVSYAWTGSAFPGLDRLAKDCGVHVNSIQGYLKELKDKGLVNVERRGMGKTNLYTLMPVVGKLADMILKDLGDSQYIVNHDSQYIVNHDSQQSVIKQYSIKHTQNEKEKDMRQPAKPKAKSHLEIAKEHIEQARLGSLKWDKVTDRDFTLYYIEEHNKKMEKPITFDRYSSVTIFREHFIKGIPRNKVCEYIDEILALYCTHPNKWTSLTFNMIQKNSKLMLELMSMADRRLKPAEARFKYNSFDGENGSDSSVKAPGGNNGLFF